MHEVSRVFGLSLIWKIISDSESLWVAWVRRYLIRQGTFWDVKESTLGSWQCRKILKLRPLAAEFTCCEIGDGSNTYFWLDKWLPVGRLVDTVEPIGFYQLGVPKF
ncbi:unnamed protein product, partial [Arabidopsis halleri]